MTRFVLRRAVVLVLTMAVIVSAAFLIIRLAPGSPFASERHTAPEVLAALEARYGLDQPLWVQLKNYVLHALHGELGPSIRYPQRSVNELIADGLPASLLLGAVALAWALLVGVVAGVIAAARQNTAWDHGPMALAMVGISLPTFVLGPLLVLALSLTFYVFPPAGWGTLRHIVLPGITLGSVYAAYIARLTRGGMLEVTRADFVRTARAKGLRGSTVVWRHMLKGGLTPTVTFLGPAMARMAVGSVVVEKIFATPGLGPYFVDAALNLDYSLVMGLVIVYSTLLLVMNLVVDVAYGLLDPRVRYD